VEWVRKEKLCEAGTLGFLNKFLVVEFFWRYFQIGKSNVIRKSTPRIESRIVLHFWFFS
jgi:hypothetical protein